MSSKSSTPTENDSLPEFVAVGRVGRAHGIQGEVWVEVLTDVEERFEPESRLWYRYGERARNRLTVVSVRPHKGGLLVGFRGVVDRNDAEALQGSWLEISRQEVPEAPEDEYYHFELVGCRCVTTEGLELGRVEEVVRTSGGEMLEIRDGERRLSVPFVAAFAREVDIAGRRIVFELPPGFLETCGSGW